MFNREMMMTRFTHDGAPSPPEVITSGCAGQSKAGHRGMQLYRSRSVNATRVGRVLIWSAATCRALVAATLNLEKAATSRRTAN